MIIIIITHKRTNDLGTILELKDNRDVIYTRKQIINKLKEGISMGMQSGKPLIVEDILENNLNKLPDFYYRDDSLRPCEYL